MRYRLAYSQKEIAEHLGVSAMTVSRLLDRARKLGVVEIVVHTPIQEDSRLEDSLCSRFPLERAVVVGVRLEENPLDALARAAAFYLDVMLSPGDVLGISAGRTMTRVLPYLRLPGIRTPGDLSVVQTTGGFPNPHSYNPITTLQAFANRFGIRGTFYNLPVYAPSAEAFAAMSTHLLDPQVLEMWRTCTITVTGVGGCDNDSIYRIENAITEEEMVALQGSGAVGAIYGRWFDQSGRFLQTELNSRALGIPMEMVRKIPRKVLVSHGIEKLAAISGALASKVFNVFITSDVTAAALVDSANRIGAAPPLSETSRQ